MTNKEAIKELELMRKFNYILAPIEAFDLAIKALEERPKGKWLSSTDNWYHTCSECKREILKDSANDSFCPNCGARMEE